MNSEMLLALYQNKQQENAAMRQDAGQSYLQSLLADGTNSAGQFDIIDGQPSYDGGYDLPAKSQAWNAYVQSLGGRVTSADIANFESTYKQAKLNRKSKQIQEIGKLQTRGYSTDEIQDVIKDTPVLYNSLIDLISELEASGDPAALEQSMAMQQYLPEMRKDKGLIGDIMAGKGGMLADVMLPAAVFGAPTAYRFATGRGQQAVDDAAKAFRTERRAVTSDIKDEQKRLKAKTQEIKDKAKAIKDKQAKLKHPQKSPLLKNMRADKRALTKEKRALQSNIDELTKKRSDIKIKDPGSRISRLTKGRGFKPGFGTAGLTSYYSGDVGEMIAGEEGRQPASVLANLGLLGFGIARKNPAALWTGAAGLGAQAYNYFFGDE
tara:strand:- start:6859 stop:7995 length:1137 start_codon:yes stop_codon:yes gene_type:complete